MERATPRDILAPLSIVTLLFAGSFKLLPTVAALPVDLTVFAAGAVALGVVGRVLSLAGSRPPGGAVGAGIGVLVVIGFGLTWPATTDYGSLKRLMLSVVVLTILGVVLLVHTERRQRVWVWLHVLVGIALAATASINIENGRLGVNNISAGRASGVAVVALVTLLMSGGLRNWVGKVLAGAAIYWLVSTLFEAGSRGPVIAAASAVLFAAAFAPGQQGRVRRLVLAAGAIFVGYQLLTANATVGAARIQGYLSGEVVDVGRPELWHASVEALPDSAFAGVGWGNFLQVLTPSEMLNSGDRQYPHNLLLEVGVEAGWLAMMLVAVFIVAGLSRLRRAAVTPYGSALFAIAVFFVINAMVSGDVIDNLAMWAAVAMGWVVVAPKTTEPARLPKQTGRLVGAGGLPARDDGDAGRTTAARAGSVAVH